MTAKFIKSKRSAVKIRAAQLSGGCVKRSKAVASGFVGNPGARRTKKNGGAR